MSGAWTHEWDDVGVELDDALFLPPPEPMEMVLLYQNSHRPIPTLPIFQKRCPR